jgi:hypothetical protein
MGKYDRFEQPSQRKRPWKVHPIWRGIGCLMLIIIPVMAWAAAYEFMQVAPNLDWFPAERGMYADINLEYLVLPFSLGQLIFFFLFTMLGFVVFTFAYSLVYRIAGPPKYGPTDAPPPRKRKVRRRR